MTGVLRRIRPLVVAVCVDLTQQLQKNAALWIVVFPIVAVFTGIVQALASPDSQELTLAVLVPFVLLYIVIRLLGALLPKADVVERRRIEPPVSRIMNAFAYAMSIALLLVVVSGISAPAFYFFDSSWAGSGAITALAWSLGLFCGAFLTITTWLAALRLTAKRNKSAAYADAVASVDEARIPAPDRRRRTRRVYIYYVARAVVTSAQKESEFARELVLTHGLVFRNLGQNQLNR